MRGVFSDGVDRLGSQAKSTLISHLQQSQRFSVLDRDNMAEASQEAKLQGATQAIRGASFVITGDISEFGRKEVGDVQFFGVLGRGKRQIAYAKVSCETNDFREACMMRRPTLWAPVAALLLLAGCATKPPPLDYTAFKQSKPAGLLVLPPLNESADVKGAPSMWVNATRPLAEAGYYVFPVTLVDETLRQNGIQSATDAHSIAVDKLRDYFGADAAVYITVKNYGTKYAVLASETVVEAEAKIVDLRSGAVLWSGRAQATSAEMQQQQQAGLVGILVLALVKQIAGTAADAAFDFGGTASERLFATEAYNGVLPGPRSPNHGKEIPRQ